MNIKNLIMKKITLFLLLCSISILSFSQDSKVPDTAKLTVSKVYNDVKAGLSGLSEALKVGAEHVYQVLVKQQTANSITNLIVMILLFIIGGIGINYARNTYKGHLKLCNFKEGENRMSMYNNSPNLDDSVKGVLSIIISILSAITIISAVVFICHNINQTIAGFINPEYGAIKDIINFVK